MKKRITKIAIVLLAISFILGSALNISSAAPTIDQNKKGSLTLFKYEVANTSEYTTPGTGETETVTETDTTKPLQGVTFELYKVGNVDSIQTDATDPATYTPTGTPVTKTTDVNGKAEFTNLDLGRYYVVETDAPENVSQKTAPFFVDVPTTDKNGENWIYDVKVYPKNQTVYGSALLTKTDADDSTKPLQGAKYDLYQTAKNGQAIAATKRLTGLTTNANGQIIVENLPVGEYYFIETEAPTGYIVDNVTKHTFTISASGTIERNGGDANATVVTPINPNVAQVNDTNNKNLIINKSVTEQGTKSETQDVEKNVKWITNSTIPKDIDIYTSYVISDDLEDELTYVNNSLVVKVDAVTLVEGTDYTFTEPDSNNKMSVSLTEAGRTKAKNALKINPEGETTNENLATKDLIVEFETKVNTEALNSLGREIKNDATLTYKVSTKVNPEDPTNPDDPVPNETDVPDEDEPEVHTGGYTFIKVNSSETPLAGAEFKISKSENPTASDYITAYDKNNTVTDTFVSDSNGNVQIKGLAYGDYYLVEVKAPTDNTGKAYNLLKEPKKIAINATSHLTTAGNKIINKMGPILPITGGNGTIAIIVAGIVIIAIGIIVFKKGSKKE